MSTLSTQEYNKMYYAANKDKIKQQMFAKQSCTNCNREVNHQNMTRHKKSQLCINNKASTRESDMLLIINNLQKEVQLLMTKAGTSEVKVE